MENNILFGNCLKFILSTLGISVNRLSKAINVDYSLVNRWVNGNRIPAYNTIYIESISEYLSKNIQNSFQIQNLDELFSNVCKNYDLIDSNKEKIKMALLEAQGYSIECKKNEQKENKNPSTCKKQTSKSSNNYQLDSASGAHSVDKTHISDMLNITGSVTLSSDDKIIIGTKNIVSAGTFLLEAAVNQKCTDNKVIYITLNNDLGIISQSYNMLISWKKLILELLNSGWHVSLLLTLSNNISKNLKFIDFILELLKTGRLSLYYLKKYDANTTGREIYVISGIGALSCFPANTHSETRYAFYLKNKLAADIFKDYFNVLLKTYTQPLGKYYSQENNFDYSCCLIESEEGMGNRFLFKYCFSVLALPENLYEKLLKTKNISSDEMLKASYFYKRRLDAFLSNIRIYQYKDIYLQDSIKDLIMHKQYCFYSYTGIEVMKLDVQDIIEFLQNIIRLLETYDNYNIAFMPQNFDCAIKSNHYYFIVRERHAVLLEAFEPSKSIPEVRLSIEEPMIIKAFIEYFKDIWDQIAPVNKDKNEIITWIQSQIDLLDK